MTIRRFCLAAGPIALLAIPGWFAWRCFDTPAPPEMHLDHLDGAVSAALRQALAEVREEPRSGAAWGKLAMVAASNGYRRQALMCFAHAQRFDPTNPCWPYLQGCTLLLGHPASARPFLQQALWGAATDSDRAVIHFRLALAFLEDGQEAGAAEHLDALRRIEPASDRVHFGLALLANAQRDGPRAREHLETLRASAFARKQANASLAALAHAEGDEALARMYQQHAVRLPADLPWPDPFLVAMNSHAVGRQSRFVEADRLESAGKLRDAVVVLRQVATATPDARSYLALALALGKLQEFDEAEQMFEAVIRVDPQNRQAHFFLGALYLNRGETRSRQPGGQVEARVWLGKAVAAEDAALAINADYALAHQVRGRALCRLDRRAEGVAALREAVQCRPEYADSHLYLGEALQAEGEFVEAQTQFEDAARLAPPDDTRASLALAALRAIK